eukprot:scaffold7574_cov144-Isochrysis_galbana.AAC.2
MIVVEGVGVGASERTRTRESAPLGILHLHGQAGLERERHAHRIAQNPVAAAYRLRGRRVLREGRQSQDVRHK